AHFDGASSFGAWTRSIILHISVASAASCPLTSALPASLQKSPRQESTSISMRSWSPGTTGRRNRAPSTATKYSSLLSRSGISSSSNNPPVCAIDSMISTPGITGCPGKCPYNMCFFILQFLDADDPLHRFHFENGVAHKKWIAVRHFFLVLFDVVPLSLPPACARPTPPPLPCKPPIIVCERRPRRYA